MNNRWWKKKKEEGKKKKGVKLVQAFFRKKIAFLKQKKSNLKSPQDIYWTLSKSVFTKCVDIQLLGEILGWLTSSGVLPLASAEPGWSNWGTRVWFISPIRTRSSSSRFNRNREIITPAQNSLTHFSSSQTNKKPNKKKKTRKKKKQLARVDKSIAFPSLPSSQTCLRSSPLPVILHGCCVWFGVLFGLEKTH